MARRATSNLQADGDDFPLAAEKFLDDAKALHAARRYDGAAYMAGYVAECSFKTILLLELLARDTGSKTPTQLALALATSTTWRASLPEHVKRLRKKISHDVSLALRVARGRKVLEPLLACGAATNPYLRGIRETWSVLRWDPFQRYQGPGRVGAASAKRRVQRAERILSTSVSAMRRDGVVRE